MKTVPLTYMARILLMFIAQPLGVKAVPVPVHVHDSMFLNKYYFNENRTISIRESIASVANEMAFN